MKIAFVVYPMLFQTKGGLQIQVQESLSSLNLLGVSAKIFDHLKDNLKDFDIIHVFSSANGNDKTIQLAKELKLKVVLSPLARCSWNNRIGITARVLNTLIQKSTNYHVNTDYSQIAKCYDICDQLICLGQAEKNSILSAFNVNKDKFNIVPNGVDKRYFDSSPDLYINNHIKENTQPLILTVGSINPNKNQLTMVKALQGLDVNIHLIGPCQENHKSYLQEILSYKNVKYIGYLSHNDPMLASAYAAADIFCLPSIQEVLPLSIFEALAAGTPVAATNNSSISFPTNSNTYKTFPPTQKNEIKTTISKMLKKEVDKQSCSELVNQMTWTNVGLSLLKIYDSII